MRASKLRQKIIVQHRVEDGSVEYPKVSWQDFTVTWADMQDLSTKDSLKGQAIGISLVSRCIIRYSEKNKLITSDMRVFFDGRYYQINGVPKRDLGDRRTYITLELKEGLKEWR